jgi:hypothetical protein
MPKRRGGQEWEPPVPISIERNGVTHEGHYELEAHYSKPELRMIRVTGEGGSKTTHSKCVASAVTSPAHTVRDRCQDVRPVCLAPRNADDHVAAALAGAHSALGSRLHCRAQS